MDTPKPKRGCEEIIESSPISVNETGYDEEPAKYMANPVKGFFKAIKNIFSSVLFFCVVGCGVFWYYLFVFLIHTTGRV